MHSNVSSNNSIDKIITTYKFTVLLIITSYSDISGKIIKANLTRDVERLS
jgi:hypothetical protein